MTKLIRKAPGQLMWCLSLRFELYHSEHFLISDQIRKIFVRKEGIILVLMRFNLMHNMVCSSLLNMDLFKHGLEAVWPRAVQDPQTNILSIM